MKMIFNYYANKTHFHNNGFALSLVLKVRFFGTRKWPIRNRWRRIWIPRLSRVEKSLRHVAMVAKFLDGNKQKTSLKSEFALFQTSPILFNFI